MAGRNTVRRKQKNRRRRMTRKGGANYNQIGRAAAMRSWFDGHIRKTLNNIVHSADHDANPGNPYKSMTNHRDPEVERVLSNLWESYEERKSTNKKPSQRAKPSQQAKPSNPLGELSFSSDSETESSASNKLTSASRKSTSASKKSTSASKKSTSASKKLTSASKKSNPKSKKSKWKSASNILK